MASDDSTFGGYLRIHARPPAFSGSDGAAYSASPYVAEEPDAIGRFGAAVLFVRWSDAGERPVGHVESPYVAFGASPQEAEAGVLALTLHDLKRLLDEAIERAGGRLTW